MALFSYRLTYGLFGIDDIEKREIREREKE
jgi:hypothetical protein